MMPENKRKPNPNALIAIGVCYMGAGVALGIALKSNGASGVLIGPGLVVVGVVFILTGAAQKRDQQVK